MSGRFVVLEGGDGSGKSTQVARLADWLREAGLEVVETREPGGTALGIGLRELLLHGDGPVDPWSEALMMAADRAQHVAEVVRPALARGAWVVSDRYAPSSLVYQGVLRGLGVDVVAALNLRATVGLEPDLVVVLDVSDAVAESRLVEGDRLEREGAGFHSAVRDAYRALARERGWVIVTADGPESQVARLIVDAVQAHLDLEGPRAT